MGTNYDWTAGICLTCGHAQEERHIGKSSAGWCFSLHMYPDNGIRALSDWIAKWKANPTGIIRNEYEEVIPVEEMIDIITNRSWPERDDVALSPEWFRVNQAEPGPKGLARHKVNLPLAVGYGTWCIGHGEGTWDLIIGEFS